MTFILRWGNLDNTGGNGYSAIENCVEFRIDGLLNDVSCNVVNKYVCEADVYFFLLKCILFYFLLDNIILFKAVHPTNTIT